MKLEEDIRSELVIRVAEEMLTAARTAPKARGNKSGGNKKRNRDLLGFKN